MERSIPEAARTTPLSAIVEGVAVGEEEGDSEGIVGGDVEDLEGVTVEVSRGMEAVATRIDSEWLDRTVNLVVKMLFTAKWSKESKRLCFKVVLYLEGYSSSGDLIIGNEWLI